MRQEIAILIFKLIWGGLLIIAVLAQARFKGKLLHKGGAITNMLVVAPYAVVFGWFSVRNYVGTFGANIIIQVCGMMIALCGVAGYIVSILYLRHNWAVSAAIKEGHVLVRNGPYAFVRHPMYFFMILTALGSGLLISNFLIILYTPVIALLYYLRSKKEEEMLIKALPEYVQYSKETKMLIPGIF
ncbi:MAG: isoprenylcysteine carboxylmethyltransferase family protein [Candidatus Omnitrophota bacterium]